MLAGRHVNNVSEFTPSASVPERAYQLEDALRQHHHELVTALLADRHVLRMISAPRGFGRTTLAREYARMTGLEDSTLWIDGRTSDFICALDTSTFTSRFSLDSGEYQLVVIDELVRLDTHRAHVLSDILDDLMEQGIELIIISTPANDCLSLLQGDRVLVEASELIVDPRHPPHEGAQVIEGFFDKVEGIPSMVWMDRAYAVGMLIDGFLDEDLPHEFLLVASVLLLVEKGSLDDLADLRVPVGNETLQILDSDYPLFGLERYKRSFHTIPVHVEEIAAVPELIGALVHHDDGDLVERVACLLLNRGDSNRALDIARSIMRDDRRCDWIERFGFEIIDQGNPRGLVRILDEDDFTVVSPRLSLLLAWSRFLSGDRFTAFKVVRTDDSVIWSPMRYSLSTFCTMAQKVGGSVPRCITAVLEDRSLLACGIACRTGLAEGTCPICQGIGPSVDDEKTCSRWALLYWVATFTSRRRRTLGSGIPEVLFKDPPSMLSHFDDEGDARCYRIALTFLTAYAIRERAPYADELVSRLARTSAELFGMPIIRFSSAFPIRLLESLGLLTEDEDPEGIFQGARMESATFMLGFLHGCRERRISSLARNISRIEQKDIGDILSDVFDPPDGNGPNGALLAEESQRHSKPAHGFPIPIRAVTANMPRLKLRFFGRFEAAVDGQLSNHGVWRKRNVRMLMTLLAIETGREVSRERVYSVLWPEADYTHARDNFYALWSILRRSLGELSVPDDCLIRMPESIRLNRELVSADTMELEYLVRMLSSSRLDDAELIGGYSHVDELYQGDLIDMDDHQHIFETARTGYRDLFVNAMIEGSTLAIRMNQGLSALLFAQRAYEQGEPSEEVYRCVMRAQVHEGMYGSARATFEEYREFVAQTYGLPPSQEMVELYDRIILPRWRGRRTDLDLAVE